VSNSSRNTWRILRDGEVGPCIACVPSVFSWIWGEQFQRIEATQGLTPHHHDANTFELCDRVPCTSRLTGCKRPCSHVQCAMRRVPCTSRLTGCKQPWWSNRSLCKQVWESNQTVWQTIQTVWFDWGYWLTQLQSQRIYGIPLSKYTFVITAITILPLFNSFPS